jgi:nucleoside-diphosphate-sugar epimerase
MRVLIAGCGWLGTALGRALLSRGDRVTGLRSDPARAAALAAHGIEPLVLDLTAPGALARLPAADAVVACQSAGWDSADGYRAAYLDANRTLLEAARRDGAMAFVYTGSTRVFGQSDGSLVTETTPVAPSGAEGEILVEAERLMLGASQAGGLRTSLIRFSGLYGPGRTGLVDRVASGAMALGPGDDAFMNFCHLDDAVTFVLAALDRGAPGAAYHGSDAAPPRRREVVSWVAERLGIELPRGRTPSFGGANRRIDSAWSREALGVTLKYPSFREGYGAVLAGR